MNRAFLKHDCWQYLTLFLFIFFGFYFAIGAYPLFDNNEGLYASIAKSMLLHKQFIIPYLNCVPYIEKPPLLYWLLSCSFSIFGFTAFAARLITVTTATLTCVMLVLFAKKIKQSQIGITSALIFTSSIGVSIIARMVYFDMLFTFLVGGSLFCLFYWYESQKISILRISYLFLGLAVLAKGLIAIILIFGSFTCFLILEKDYRRMYKTLDLVGIIIFLITILPWHIAAIIEHKGFLKHYIIEEHVLRFLNKREPHDYYNGPVYYYLPRIIIYIFPWSFFVSLIFWRVKNIDGPQKRLLRFLWCWLLIPLTLFSFSSAKANYYMIVSVPAIAMMLGIKINNLFIAHPKIFSVWSMVVLLIATCIFSTTCLFFSSNYAMVFAICGLAAGIIIVLVMILAGYDNISYFNLVIVVLSSLIIPFVIAMVSYIKTTKDNLSAEEVGTYLTSKSQNKSLYIYQDFESISALSFYAPKCFKIIDSKSNDLYYGKNLPEFKQWFVSKEEFLHDISKEQAYIVVPIKKLQQFYQDMGQTKFSLLERFNRVVIVGNKMPTITS